MGHDDLLKPNHIEIMLNEFDEHTAFVYCNIDLIDENDTLTQNHFQYVNNNVTNETIISYEVHREERDTTTIYYKEYDTNVNPLNSIYRNVGYPFSFRLGRFRYF